MNKLDRIRIYGTPKRITLNPLNTTIRNKFNTQTIMKGQTYV